MGVLHAGQRIEDQADFEKIFRNAWADNANACAKQYAGTGAMKTDFIRTGRRTHWGLLMDGWTSVMRYCKNNFYDGFRQDSIDLFLGNYIVDEMDLTTSLSDTRGGAFLSLPFLVLSFSLFYVHVLSLLTAEDSWLWTLQHALIWGVVSLVNARNLLCNGINVPQLVQNGEIKDQLAQNEKKKDT